MLRAALDVSRRQLWDLQARFQDIGEDGASILVTQGLRTELADRERQIERLQRERATLHSPNSKSRNLNRLLLVRKQRKTGHTPPRKKTDLV